ncbi:MAG: nicotinate phosphoribosyltransferase [Burkholderiales bacterium]|jgi:nicotinate phosphoribosyltransferase|nr:nicotinate phosphoribosyltransferase [Burkholderiales bacterium]
MIIRSLLDTDLYKFTMMQVALHHFPAAQVEYRFKCRNEGVDLAPIAEEVSRQIKALCELRFAPEELEYLRSLRFIKSDFVDLLGLFKLDDRFVRVSSGPTYKNGLDITIKGPWLHTILFEIPVLAIVSEVYYRHAVSVPDFTTGRTRLAAKVKQFEAVEEDFRFSDYGTRRRFSYVWQEEVLRTLQQGLPGKFVGTSNVHFARQLGLTPLGTMSHEYLQACQAVGPRLRDSQSYAFGTWAREYRGDLGIALSDVYGMDAFLRDFDLFFCKLFDGVRHDSGDPFEWGDKLIAHYQKMRIDPRGKTMVFSDSLTPELAIRLFHYFKNRMGISFGIGTNLTNDLGYLALQNVIKMTRCNGQPVAKISDSPSKVMDDDPMYVNYLREVFQTPEKAGALSKKDSRS